LIERGESNPTWGTVRGIAKALEVSVAELARRAGRIDGEIESKADPTARDQGIGFRIGDAFPADDPIIEGDLPPEQNLYYFRLIAGHFFEIATWLKETRKTWPEINALVDSLDENAQERYANIVAFASQKHPLHKRLGESRSTLFHYPTMHPEREAAGAEELANAMREAMDAEGWIEGGDDYATFRAAFADEVALQFLATSDEETEEIMEALRGPVFELVELTEAVLLAHLKTLPADATVIWEKGDPRPELPGSEASSS
jgi:transcriptional regulator with XRE-family HTH domain